jgi:hypothetical protein
VNPRPDPWYRSHLFWRVAVLLALGLVFVSYLRADLLFDVANMVWSCF